MPHFASLHLCLHANKCHPSTIATRVNDLYKILKESHKPACVILSDGGVNFLPKNVINSLFQYRLFKEINYDMLSVSTYASRYSAYNPIEHAWSPLSNMLTGIIFSPKMEGDS